MNDPKIQPATNLAPADKPDTDDSLAQVLGEVNKLTQIIADDERERQETIIAALGQQVGHLTQALRTREEKNAVQGLGRAPNDRLLSYLSGRDELERFGQVVDWLFGVKGAGLPDPQYRRADAIYWALTGDYEFRGMFDKERAQLASASTVTMADMAVNAMNKVLLQQFSDLGFWRWYERIVAVTPNDGSVQAMQWITYGGVGNLPSVAEGGAYTELAVGDVKESSSFTKFGGYVGITREMIKNSDIVRIQAVPRALATAAVRTRSAAVAGIFTSTSGVGPTLAQDGVALFNAAHSNLGTTAFAQAEWRVVRAAIFKHVEVQSGKRLGMYPRFAIFPPDLYDAALAVFGYGDGYPTAYTPEAQDRGLGDPRPVPLVCPDFTDATDWAAIVDPQVYPVICMSYSQLPGGGSHPIPELFSVVNETAGLMFTNDTLPIKVRDEFAVGVNGPRGIYKENVAG